MKAIAMYLPQFHRVPENDAWWGEEFTDWISTQKAVPLFEGHVQPRVPKDKNYYNLMEKEVMVWQANLMHQYGVDGMCMYHYWFKDGKQILEKPVENLLEWTDIDMPYCLYWANESWIRSWSKMRNANAWLTDEENTKRDEDSGVLLEQHYGGEKEWRAHFEYLLPFFKDPRYITVNDKPLFMIYKSAIIPELEEMLSCWKQWAKEAGLEGLYVIGAYTNGNLKQSLLDAGFYHEPPRANAIFRERYRGDGVCKIEYDEIWQYILEEFDTQNKIFYSGFSGYDDTPRRGTRGMVIVHQTSEKFAKYLSELMAKNEAVGNDITFINAWNEWGEGMYLEPDEADGTKYLEAVSYAKTHYKEYVSLYRDKFETKKKTASLLQQRCDKYESYLFALDRWMELREEGINLEQMLIKRGCKHVALYGYGILGRHFVQEVKNSEIELDYIIDQNKEKIELDIPSYTPYETLPECDAVVVSSFYFMDEVRAVLPKHFKLISIETLIRDIE